MTLLKIISSVKRGLLIIILMSFNSLIPAQESSIDYPNINISNDSFPQNEPSVKISRANPNYVVAVWRDFRTGVNPAVRRVGYSVSSNGGFNWSPSVLLQPYSQEFPRASDPVITVDLNGNFYISVIAISVARVGAITAVYKSTDNGSTFFQLPVVSPLLGDADDYEKIACDLSPSSPYANNIYVVWPRYYRQLERVKLLLARSTNGGNSWVTTSVIDSQTFCCQSITIGTNGEIYIAYHGCVQNLCGIYVRKSIDGGSNFQDPVMVYGLPTCDGISIASDISNSPRRGYVYVTWTECTPESDLFLSYSSDGGVNWSPKIRVTDDPFGSTSKQVWPSIEVNEQGNIAAVFYNMWSTNTDTLTEAYLAYSSNGGLSFLNKRISSTPSPVRIPNSDIRFGDYIGIDYYGKIIPVWTDERAGGYNMEIYCSVIENVVGVPVTKEILPGRFALYQNYPNPFNPVTKIKFDIPSVETHSNASLRIYDILGREVATLVNEELKPGTYEIEWDGTNYPSGVYYYKLSTGDYTDTKKMVLLK